jgi:site-specific DNA-adenine methylase
MFYFNPFPKINRVQTHLPQSVHYYTELSIGSAALVCVVTHENISKK